VRGCRMVATAALSGRAEATIQWASLPRMPAENGCWGATEQKTHLKAPRKARGDRVPQIHEHVGQIPPSREF
jgi:hypothetical protein